MLESEDGNTSVTGLRVSQILDESKRESSQPRLSAIMRETVDRKLTTGGMRATDILAEHDPYEERKDNKKIGNSSEKADYVNAGI